MTSRTAKEGARHEDARRRDEEVVYLFSEATPGARTCWAARARILAEMTRIEASRPAGVHHEHAPRAMRTSPPAAFRKACGRRSSARSRRSSASRASDLAIAARPPSSSPAARRAASPCPDDGHGLNIGMNDNRRRRDDAAHGRRALRERRLPAPGADVRHRRPELPDEPFEESSRGAARRTGGERRRPGRGYLLEVTAEFKRIVKAAPGAPSRRPLDSSGSPPRLVFSREPAARHRLPQRRPASPTPGPPRSHPDDGVRQHGRRLRHGECVTNAQVHHRQNQARGRLAHPTPRARTWCRHPRPRPSRSSRARAAPINPRERSTATAHATATRKALLAR